MRRVSALGLAAGLAFVAANCGDDLGTGNQTDFDGIRYTAEVVLVPTGGQTLLSVVATLHNLTATSKSRTYPAGCPVRILLYRQADNALLYDERKRDCSSTPVATITVDPQSTKQLQSGVRFPGSLAGDSLPFTTYNVRAAVQTEGASAVLVDAGTYLLTGSGAIRQDH